MASPKTKMKAPLRASQRRERSAPAKPAPVINLAPSEENLDTVPAARKWLKARLEKAKQQGIVSEVVDLTPALAKVLLEKNDWNRHLRQAKLGQYVDDILNDRWQLNGEPIIIANDASLNNGQHRCNAVIQAKKSIKTVMLFGLAPETRQTIDQGAARSAGDHLSVAGYHYGISMSATARFILAWERGGKERLSDTNRITSAEIIERAMADEGISASGSFPYKSLKKSKRFAPPSVIGFCHYVMSKENAEQAETFLNQVIQGLDLGINDPAYVVRERLIETGKNLREHKIEIILRGWNAYRMKKAIKQIKVTGQLPPIM